MSAAMSADGVCWMVAASSTESAAASAHAVWGREQWHNGDAAAAMAELMLSAIAVAGAGEGAERQM